MFLPVISEGLIDMLDRAFPDKAPRDPNLSAGEIGVLVGQQQVLDHLRAQLKKQQKREA